MLNGFNQVSSELQRLRGIFHAHIHEFSLGPEGHADGLSEQGVLNGVHGLSLSE